MAVSEVAAVREIEAENGVAGLQNGRVGRGIGLRAGVRLHIDVLAAEELARAIAGKILDDVGVFAAAVITAAGIALGIFVGEDRAGGFEHGFRDEVFAGDHLQPLVLAEGFLVNGGGNFRIGLGEGEGHAVSHTKDFKSKGAESLLEEIPAQESCLAISNSTSAGSFGIRFGTASPGEAELLIENHG